jgi:hypothetical protein
MADKRFILGGFKPLVLAISTAAAIISGAAIMVATNPASAASGGNSDAAAAAAEALPKSQRPMNVNPNKSPVLDLSQIKPEAEAPALSREQQISQAKNWAADSPDSRVVCFSPDGSVAGMAELSKIQPGLAFSRAQADKFCNNAAPGSHS